MSVPGATSSSWSRLAPQLLTMACVWLVLCIIALFEFGLWPRTLVGWVVTFALGPAAAVAFMVAGELAIKLFLRVPWVRRSHEWVERRTAQKRFSWLRVGYALTCCSLLLVVLVVWWAYDNSHPRHEAGALKQFIAGHFR